MRIVRQSAFVATAWKNGGGVTHEAIRVPVAGAPFRWRVSVAQIDASGPFSDFTGYQRTMVLIRGAGVRLTFGGTRLTQLRAPGDLVEFDGALRTQCDLVDGSCTDLNLMISRALVSARAWVAVVDGPCSVEAAPGETQLVFPIVGGLTLSSTTTDCGGLATWDLAVLDPGDVVTAAPVPDLPAPLVFFAKLADNRT
jgi:environmental stress-induced protein Ves